MKKKSKPKIKKVKSTPKSKKGILPFGDRVLVRPMSIGEAEGKKNSYGIIIPETVKEEKSAQGRVLAVGDGGREEGRLVPMRVKVGDLVIFSKYGYDEVEQNGEELYLIKEENILAIIK